LLPYFFANFLSISILFIGYRFKFNKIALLSLFFLAAIPLIFITAFKASTVGTDTVSYIYFFNRLANFQALLAFIEKQGEVGFWLLNYIGHAFSDNHYIIFLYSSLIVTTCYLYSIKTFNLKTLSLFTLLFIGPYYFQLNGTRQAIAIAVFAVSVVFIIKKQPIRYIISIFIGFLFHKSIIICLPLYLIFRKDIKPKKVAAIIVLFIVVLVFFQTFINFAASIDTRYSSYGDRTESHGGVMVSMFNILLFAWFMICRNINRVILGTRTFDTLLTLYLMGVLISLLSIVLKVDPSGFLRMSLYFIQMNIFLLPMTIISFKDDSTRYIINSLAVLLMMVYFYLTTSAFSHLTPYKFNPIIDTMI